MVPEIIDLTNSPPSPPRSSNVPIVLNSLRQIQFEKAPLPLMACTNPNPSQTNQQQITTLWPISGHTSESSQIVTRFQPDMQGGVVRILEPILESNTYLDPHGAWFNEPWTQREHELFVMGLIKYGKGRWTKIARDFVCSKTPQEVQSYAANFSRHLPPPTYPHGFRRRNPTYTAPYLIFKNWNLMVGASTLYSMPIVVNQSQQLLTPVLVNVPFLLAPPYGEASTNTIMYGFQMHTSATTASNTSMNAIASANEEIDLELRLGPSQ
ncbi:Transcription factor DIVARICATA [Spatholobus suberectus]|nr:Transcription factor DIVARICATA [Spatholobus suberectus]